MRATYGLICVLVIATGCATIQSTPSISPSASCSVLRSQLAGSGDSNLVIRVLACELKEENVRHCAGKPPNQPCGKIFIASLPSKVNGAHVVGQIVDVSHSGRVASICGSVASVILQAKGALAPVAYAGGGVATYNCDAMLRAAARNDPIVIFGPQAVAFKEMAGDGVKVAQKVADAIRGNVQYTALSANIVVPMFQYNAVAEVLNEKKITSLPGITLDPEATLRNIQNAPNAIKEGVEHAVEEIKKLCSFCG